MKIKASKSFAKYVDRLVKELGIAEEANFGLVGHMFYPDVFNPESFMDYDPGTDKYRVIEIFYPDEYYASSLVISTPMLNNEMKHLKVKTEQGLKEMLRDMIEV